MTRKSAFLFGTPLLSLEQNHDLFFHVHSFISELMRFQSTDSMYMLPVGFRFHLLSCCYCCFSAVSGLVLFTAINFVKNDYF